jgi:hypothetical protein
MLSVEKPKLQAGPKTDWALVPERIWTEYHPVLGWYHQKNKHAVLKLRDFEVDVNTNSQGFRGKQEYAFEKPSPITRILCLGDSFVFGFGVKDEESFCAQLQAKDQILMAYREIAKNYQSDYVLIGIFPEGFWRATRAFADTGHAKLYFSLSASEELELHNVPVPPQYELNANQFPLLIQQRPIENFLSRSLVYRFFKKKIIKLGKNLGWIDPDLTEEWILGKAILKQLIEEIKLNKSEPLFVILPPDRWVKTARPDSLHRSLLRFFQREEVDFIDLTPEFHQAVQQSSLTDYYIEEDWHWTAKGHELAAETIQQFLARKRQ